MKSSVLFVALFGAAMAVPVEDASDSLARRDAAVGTAEHIVDVREAAPEVKREESAEDIVARAAQAGGLSDLLNGVVGGLQDVLNQLLDGLQGESGSSSDSSTSTGSGSGTGTDTGTGTSTGTGTIGTTTSSISSLFKGLGRGGIAKQILKFLTSAFGRRKSALSNLFGRDDSDKSVLQTTSQLVSALAKEIPELSEHAEKLADAVSGIQKVAKAQAA